VKQKTPLRSKKKLNLRTLGISNWAHDSKTEKNIPEWKKRYSIQFYDYDFNGNIDRIPINDLERILEIFPYDCLMYETKHGIHFISFSVLHGLKITKSRVLETSKDLGLQDYWTEAKDLTLRVSAKWKVRLFRIRKIVSKKPKFKGLIREPNQYRISKNHLEFYRKYMNLPDWVYELYNDCVKLDYRIKMYHYKTRD
jgi:hypothetical protein